MPNRKQGHRNENTRLIPILDAWESSVTVVGTAGNTRLGAARPRSLPASPGRSRLRTHPRQTERRGAPSLPVLHDSRHRNHRRSRRRGRDCNLEPSP